MNQKSLKLLFDLCPKDFSNGSNKKLMPLFIEYPRTDIINYLHFFWFDLNILENRFIFHFLFQVSMGLYGTGRDRLSKSCPGPSRGKISKPCPVPCPAPSFDWLSRPVPRQDFELVPLSLCCGTMKEFLSICPEKLHCP